ncbi:hypothetical protein T12_9996 [Trichinella patagoniensis]|uniref:Uncharacterized protein n=1 Tax=Trichinella patagoniensis TaxID=990121 RepID=A0A0V1AEC4_9BILA|nr:hypothetical protein T12_9996 [Trichinella patagoniensis]
MLMPMVQDVGDEQQDAIRFVGNGFLMPIIADLMAVYLCSLTLDVRFNPQAVGELNDARVVWIRLMELQAVVKHYKNRWLVVAQELSVSTLMLKKSVKIPSHGP